MGTGLVDTGFVDTGFVEAGFVVRVFNRTRGPEKALAKLGAVACISPADCADGAVTPCDYAAAFSDRCASSLVYSSAL